MANEKNLKPFTKDNQPPGYKKSRKGIPNRSTVLKRWLYGKSQFTNPLTLKKAAGTVEDEVVLALITRAKRGNIAAIKEILDTVYGKITDKHELTGEGGGPIPITIIEPVKPDA